MVTRLISIKSVTPAATFFKADCRRSRIPSFLACSAILIAQIILGEGNAIRIAEQARKEGILDLRQSALRKVAAGITDLIEINRVTKD